MYFGPKKCHCKQNVTVTGVTVSGEACIFNKSTFRPTKKPSSLSSSSSLPNMATAMSQRGFSFSPTDPFVRGHFFPFYHAAPLSWSLPKQSRDLKLVRNPEFKANLVCCPNRPSFETLLKNLFSKVYQWLNFPLWVSPMKVLWGFVTAG